MSLKCKYVDSAAALDFTHTRAHAIVRNPCERTSERASGRVCACLPVDAEAGGERVIDPAGTVSSRIALLPANVCHVWHTRRAGGHARRVRVRARFSRTHARTHARVSYSGEYARHIPRTAHCCTERTHSSTSHETMTTMTIGMVERQFSSATSRRVAFDLATFGVFNRE